MIGRLRYGKNVVVLTDDLEWSCPDDPGLAESFDLLYGADECGPSDGDPGFVMFYRAVDGMECEVIDAPVADDTPIPDGVVF